MANWISGLVVRRGPTEDISVNDEPSRQRSLELLRRIAREETSRVAAQVERSRPSRPARSTDLIATIAAARARPIVFRECYPPSVNPGLSFYGGVPVGPPTMTWPRGTKDDRPLTFLMQWESAALAAEDATGLLPTTGALYLFSSLRWGDEMLFAFVHQDGETAGWTPLPIPADLPPAWGDRASSASPFVSPHVAAEVQQPPRLLPCWPFRPIAIDYPAQDGDDEVRFWNDGPAVKEVLVRVQDPEARLLPDPVTRTPAFARPFANFPHDWAAVRVLAAAALDERLAAWQWETIAPDADDEARQVMVQTWQAEASALYVEATKHALGDALNPAHSDELWERIRLFEPLLFPFGVLVGTCINVSLGLGGDGATAIPAALVERVQQQHSLGYAWMRAEYQHEFIKRTGDADALEEARVTWRESRSDEDMQRIRDVEGGQTAAFERAKADGALASVREVWAPVPNRMFGAPSYVQGYVEEYVEDRVLLLELTGSSSIGLGLGDGVLQFMIRPDDLIARQFDRVEVVASGY